MRYEFGDTISSYVIEPGTPVTGGRLAVLRGNAEVWFYDADTGGSRYTSLLDASLAPTNNIKTTNAASDLGYLPKFYGPDGVTFMWADANGGAGPRHRIEFNDEKLALAGAQTIIGDKTITGLISSTNTHSWEMPIQADQTLQIGAISIRNDNTVGFTDSPDLFVIYYKGNTDGRRSGWFNEWGGLRVRVPPLSLLGYADVACKLFEATSGGEDGLQIFGPGGTKKFYVRDGATWADSLTLTGNATSLDPTIPQHLTTKAYVDSLIAGGAPDATTTTKGIIQLAGDLSGTATNPIVTGLSSKADDSAVVKLTGAQVVAGVKTFSSEPVVPTPTLATSPTRKDYVDTAVDGADMALTATDFGFLAWNFPGYECPGGSLISLAAPAGTVLVQKIRLRKAITATNLVVYQTAAGSGLTAGQCFIGLFDASRNLLSASADQAAAWGSGTGIKSAALSAPQNLTPGYYYVGYFFNGTTAPTFARLVNTGLANLGLTGNNSVSATADAGRTTTFPATLATLSAAALNHWVAIT